MTNPDGRIPRAGILNQPRTAAEFAQYFLKSEHGKSNANEIKDYLKECVGIPQKKEAYIESARAEKATRSLKDRSDSFLSSTNALSISLSLFIVHIFWVYPNKLPRLCVVGCKSSRVTPWPLVSSFRQYIKKELFYYFVDLIYLCSIFILQGIMIGSMFLNSPTATSGYFSRGGVLFLSVIPYFIYLRSRWRHGIELFFSQLYRFWLRFHLCMLNGPWCCDTKRLPCIILS